MEPSSAIPVSRWWQQSPAETEARWLAGQRANAAKLTDKLPRSGAARLMQGWDARLGITTADNGSPVAIANVFVRETIATIKASKFRAAYDEGLIRDHAENYSTLCSRMASLGARESFAVYIGVELPAGRNITDAGKIARYCNPLWWRRALRKVWTRQAENALRNIGAVRKGQGLYASNEAVEHRAGRDRRTREWLKSRVMVNGEGEQLELMALHEKSLANPALRRTELTVRGRGFHEIAVDIGHQCDFWTLTAPSAFHPQLSKGRPNPRYNGATAKEAQQWLCRQWARVRSILKRKSIFIYGIRVAEPHHDGTPHWHLQAFGDVQALQLFHVVLRSIWLSEFGDEEGARKYRCKVERIDPAKGSAVGYLAKYISKNIDGAGGIGEASSDEDDGAGLLKDNVARVKAWAAVHGIRQFQQFGGPPVGLWREARRLREAVADPDIERIRAAADSGNFREFIYALSPDHIYAGRDVALTLERPAARLFQNLESPLNQYGEEKQQPVIGLRYCGGVVITRPHRWRIERQCNTPSSASISARETGDSAAVSELTVDIHSSTLGRSGFLSSRASASRSDLGPVAITVRGPDLSAGLDLSWVATVPFKAGASFGDPAAWTSRETSMAGPERLQ